MRAWSSGVSRGISRSGSSAGSPGGVGAERVEACGEMAVHPVRLDERHRGRDAAEELLVRLGRGRRAASAGAGWPFVAVAPPFAQPVAGARELRGEELGTGFEERPPLGRDGFGRR